MKASYSSKVIIDRIEGDLAVLVLYDDDGVKFNVPVALLPDGAKDGDHLAMSFAKDDASRDSEKKRIENLLAELKAK
jgi:hypothetical protein